MTRRLISLHFGGLILALLPTPALANISLSAEAASDERRRGLSWSQGRPVLRATAIADLTDRFSLEADAVTLRRDPRHGGADAAIDLSAYYTLTTGAWRWSAEARYHLFPGASGQGFAEIGAGAGYNLGPASLDFTARYAPRQTAIGGDNLHVAATLAAGIPGTPLTASAQIGRSSGKVRDPLRAQRLRPGGPYWDHRLGLDYHAGKWTAGLAYSGTNIDRPNRRHAGDALIGRIAHRF